ncbi:MAG: hypothetical protein AB8B88_07735 [Devosiaceae bacterium]
MSTKDQRTALFGWGAGALVAVGAYFGALQFYPAEPSASLVAGFPAAGIDPIFTGSIGTPNAPSSVQPMRNFDSPLQMQIDNLTMEIAALRETISATQAASLSTNRRLEVLEGDINITTASVDAVSGATADQPLPQSLDTLAMARPEPRVVLPAPIPVDGGAIALSVRPLQITDEGEAAPTDDMQAGQMLSQTPFAVDLGGGATLEEIDALWLIHRQSFGETLSTLSPRILLQQTSEGTLDLRLVAGPINDAADAAMLCAQLVAAGMDRCLPAIFDGQQLALR